MRSRKKAFAAKFKEAFEEVSDMYGWIGTILRVNLTNGTVKEAPDPELASSTSAPGASGAKIICDEVDPKMDPLEPGNKLIFAPGPAHRDLRAVGGRYEVITKGPLTGAIAGSNSGGNFGPELKKAGYDRSSSRARRPSPSTSGSGTTRWRSATPRPSVGKDTPDTTDMMRAETDDEAKVAVHRAGRGAAGALRRHHERMRPGRRPHRRRRGDGVQEPEGGRGAGRARSRSPTRALQGRRA